MNASDVASAPARKIGCWHLTESPARGEGRYPEGLSAEQREFQAAVRQFIENEVVPRIGELDAQAGGPLMPELLRGLAEVGFFQAEIPEADGGLGLGLSATMPMMEEMGRGGSFHVAAMVHQGIGTQPIAYYGNDEQRAAYLPAAVAGEKFGAYALTEPSSGSDALGMKATAVRDGDGWILNGAKQFITNAGFADYFVAFAKVDGDKVTAFIVDRGAEGFEVQAEERKMGIKGSSTCPLKLTNVRVPDSRRLGEVGIGHKIALNLLNLGRLKLGVTVLGVNKQNLRDAVRYAVERKQFGERVADFGMSRMKIAECAALTFAGEAMCYRTAGFIQDAAIAAGMAQGAAEPTYADKIAAADAFSPECAMVKAWLSESGCVVADHALQLLGGYGFIEEYPTARAYRDARIARLYEGTNEINRLHAVNTLTRRASQGGMGERWLEKVSGGTLDFSGSREGVGGLRRHAEAMKSVFGLSYAGALNKLGDPRKLRGEQEIASHLADMMMELFAAESSVLRAEAIEDHPGASDEGKALGEAMARAAVGRCSRKFRDHASIVASAMAWEGWTPQFLSQIAAAHNALGSTLEAERAVAAALVDTEGEWPEFASPAE
jgi:alkylation response protein AidB-like acyl-CoA dehydrogenase